LYATKPAAPRIISTTSFFMGSSSPETGDENGKKYASAVSTTEPHLSS
jgi:hypothetical protein